MKRWLLLFCLFLSATVVAQEHHQQSQDPFTLKKLGENVYALHGRGGNVGFLVGKDSVLVVDSQFRDMAPGIVNKIKTVTDKPVKYLLNTHHHGDHTGGNEYFLPFSIILSHDNARRRMLESPAKILAEYPARLEKAEKAGEKDTVKGLSEQIEWAKKIKTEEIAAPYLTFDSEFRIHAGVDTVHVWHTPPAHTDGDSVVYFEKANVLHTGDLFFHKRVPFIDIAGGGTATGYLTALDKVIARVPPDVTIIPGHGEVTDLQGLKQFRQYIQDLVDLARKAKAAGKSKEEFASEADLPAYKGLDGYDKRFRSNAEAAYDSLGQ